MFMARKTSGNIRGYLFNVIERILLERSGYIRIRPDASNRHLVRKVRNDVIELRGRGCWHSIDCPYLMEQTAPFMPQVRIIGEVRYHMTEIKKEAIRNFIGTLTDLGEAKYLLDDQGNAEAAMNCTDVGVFFAANGFLPESERLACSHGIRTVSYKDNQSLKVLKELIFEFESNYLDYEVVMQQGNFMAQYALVLREEMKPSQLVVMYNLPEETLGILEGMIEELHKLKSSFFAVTPTGMMMHFLGAETFPEELFEETDTAVCRVKLEPGDGMEKAYYLEFADDPQGRRFYFSPPESMTDQGLYGPEPAAGERIRVIYVNIPIRGLHRQLCLVLDPDWRSALAF
jgi:hypothetical protein